MSFFSWEISIIALLPALFLCGFIYYKDKIEREPLHLLLLLFLFGAAIYIPSLMIMRFIAGSFDNIFAGYISYSPDGLVKYSSVIIMVLHKFLYAFFCVSFIEVCMKWFILFFLTRKSRHFNYLFDGIVYSVFVSLGYAAVDNIRFAWANGWDTLVLRSLSTIPFHLIVGIIMGYFYTVWNAHCKAVDLEKQYVSKGILCESVMKQPVVLLASSIIVPYIISGVYVFAVSIDSKLVKTVFYFVLFSLYGFSFIGVDRISSKDSSSNKYSKYLLNVYHPEVFSETWSDIESKTNEEENL